MSQNFTLESHPVRITVLKKHFHQEFVAKYAANPDAWTECKHFEVGQQFEVSGERPVGDAGGVLRLGVGRHPEAGVRHGQRRAGDVRHLLHRRLPAGHLPAGEGEA